VTVVGTPPVGANVNDQDDDCYFGSDPKIGITKLTNDENAVLCPADSRQISWDWNEQPPTVTWTYEVVNLGNVPLSAVTVTDSIAGVNPAYQSGDTNTNSLLDLTEKWIFTASGLAIKGQYNNIGKATGYGPGNVKVEATEPDCYFAVQLPPPPGCLEICKDVSGTNPTPDKEFTVCVQVEDKTSSEICLPVKAGACADFKDLVTGTYLLSEKDPGNGWTITKPLPATGDVAPGVTCGNNIFRVENKPPLLGCVGSPGYWLGHSCSVTTSLTNAGGTIYLGTPLGPQTVAVSSVAQANIILDVSKQQGYCTKANGQNNDKELTQLYRQLLSAKLATYNSAPNTAVPTGTVLASINAADAYFATHTCGATDRPNTNWQSTIASWASGNLGLPECPTMPCSK
jgi:hypothetical protein